jgi:hypothetical protein
VLLACCGSADLTPMSELDKTDKDAADLQTVELDESLREYRSHLVTAYQKAIEDYDKAVMSLSGGALGVSFAFVKDFIGTGHVVNKFLLFSAWMCWGISVASVISSFFVSHLSLKRAIKQVDAGKAYEQTPGGRYARITAILNASGGSLFLIGVILIASFVWKNLGER